MSSNNNTLIYGNNERFLFMDDDKEIRDNIIEIGEILNYDFTCTKNGDEALSEYKNALDAGNPYKAIFMDLSIKGDGKGGEETITELIKIDPNVVAVLFSGESERNIVHNYKDFGFSYRLEKPIDLAHLGNIIREILRKDEKM